MTEIIISISKLLNDNPGFVTLIVGSFAIYLYLKQKTNHKRDAAKLILQEVRYAEQKIRNARNHNTDYYLADKLLPTNSWHNNIHLFIKNLKESEIDLISGFYSHAAYLDVVISKISDQKNDIKIPVFEKGKIKNEQKLKKQREEKEEKIIAFQSLSQSILSNVSKQIEFIYNTPAINKLRNISEKKWYQLF